MAHLGVTRYKNTALRKLDNMELGFIIVRICIGIQECAAQYLNCILIFIYSSVGKFNHIQYLFNLYV